MQFGGGGAPGFGGGDNKELLKQLLILAGVNMTQTVRVNFTQFLNTTNLPQPIRDLLNQLGVVTLTVEQIFDLLVNNPQVPTLDFSAEYTVVDSIGGTEGKFPAALGNVVVVDSTFLRKTLKNMLFSNPTISILITAANAREQVESTLDDIKIHVCFD